MAASQAAGGSSILPTRTKYKKFGLVGKKWVSTGVLPGFEILIRSGILSEVKPIFLTSMKKVTIYTTPTCTYCNMAKEYFAEHGVQYDAFDVAKDLSKRAEMVQKSGQMGVPVIDIDGEVIVGYDQPRIAEALGISE